MRADEPFENREEIRRRFSGAGLCAADDIATRERVRQHRALHGRRLLETALIEGVEEVLIGDERRKWNGRGIVRGGFARGRRRGTGTRVLRASRTRRTAAAMPRPARCLWCCVGTQW